MVLDARQLWDLFISLYQEGLAEELLSSYGATVQGMPQYVCDIVSDTSFYQDCICLAKRYVCQKDFNGDKLILKAMEDLQVEKQTYESNP